VPRNAKELGLKPIDLLLILYIQSYPVYSFHATSVMAKALGVHENTIRAAVKRLDNLKYLRRIYRTGEANKFDLSGWRNKIRAYSIVVGSPAHDFGIPLANIVRLEEQNLYTNKEQTKNKDSNGPGKQKFDQMMRQRRRRV
jgi:hypothetical protein